MTVLLLDDALVGIVQVLYSLRLHKQHLLIHLLKQPVNLLTPHLLLLLNQFGDIAPLPPRPLYLPLSLVPLHLEVTHHLALFVDAEIHLDLDEFGFAAVVLGYGAQDFEGEVVDGGRRGRGGGTTWIGFALVFGGGCLLLF